MKSGPPSTNKEPKRGKLNKEFPAHYYEIHPGGISRKLLDEVVVDQWTYILDKVASSIWNVLHKTVDEDLKIDALSGAYAACVKQLEKSPGKWATMNEFFSYWLVSSWREFRNQGLREQKQQQTHRSLWSKAEAGEDGPWEYDTLAAPEPEEAGLPEFLHQEEFVTFVHERVYDYLDDCYLDGLFTMREISIFKIYCVNNYSIEGMVKQTQFSRTRIISALSKIKKHLLTVDFRWWQFHPDL